MFGGIKRSMRLIIVLLHKKAFVISQGSTVCELPVFWLCVHRRGFHVPGRSWVLIHFPKHSTLFHLIRLWFVAAFPIRFWKNFSDFPYSREFVRKSSPT